MSDFLSAVFFMPENVRERLLALFRLRPEFLADLERRYARKRDALARGDAAELDRILREERGLAQRFFDSIVQEGTALGAAPV